MLSVSGYRLVRPTHVWPVRIWGLLVVALNGTVCGSPDPQRLESPRPNVVLIIADDQSYRDFGFLGNQQVHTPNIDQLARRAARYPNGYVPMSVCRPSLATLLTGLYPHQHGIHFNHPPPGLRTMRTMTAQQYRAARASTDRFIAEVPTLPRLLAQHGYACLQTGKHWEGSFHNAGFTHGMTRGLPADRLSPITGTRRQDNGQWVAHGNGDAGLVIGRETMQPIYDFVDEHGSRQPFFIWYAPFLPHTPFDAPRRFRELYQGQAIPEYLLPYYAEIARFDETVGQLVDYLGDQGLLQDTLILLLCDNGFRPRKNGGQRRDARSKLSVFEDGIRTPLLIRWDGRVRPADHLQLVHSIDLVPTVLSAVGLADRISTEMQGIDLMPSARGQRPLEQRPVFGAIYPNDAAVLGAPGEHVRGRWVRSGDYKLIVPGPAPNPLNGALFDLRSDPHERDNLISQPAHASRVRQLRELLNKWWRAEGRQR